MSITKDLCDEIDSLKEEIMELKQKLEAAEERAELAEQKVDEMRDENGRLREELRDSLAQHDWVAEHFDIHWAHTEQAKEALK